MDKYCSYDTRLLLDHLSKGDQSAFTEIYNRYWKRLFTLAYKRLNETQSAEDIVHDVFVSLWINREKSEIQHLENYLASVTKYMVLSKIKTLQRERTFTNNVQIHEMVELDLDGALDNRNMLKVIRAEVEKLPERCQLIFKYSRNEDMPVKVIAQKLQISPKTVENQLYKALKHLKHVTYFLFCIV